MKPLTLFFLLSAGMLTSCGRSTESSEDKQLLAEAATYHQQATTIQAEVEPKIDQIDSLKAVLTSRSTPTTTEVTITTLDSLKTAFEEWEENLVEVPGMEHHDHQHGDHKHEHHHHTDPLMKDLPPAQMRDLQREFLTAIKQIQQRTNAIFQQVSR